jgi:asparagine synthase (glutamine-hydrolysing)
MCGIAGQAGFVDEGALRLMTQLLYHRGPDEGAIWLSSTGQAGLGHRRLRIIDLSPAARQPMRSEEGRWTITYNGELFNYRALRERLAARGHRFRTQSDTEVLLRGFIEWGEGVLAELRGQFAFAVWDDETRTLFAARDHLGIKPLYYTVDRGRLSFASEAKALLAAHPACREVRWDLVPQYLGFLWVPGGETLFRGIRKLEPGCWLRFRDGLLESGEYWNPASASVAQLPATAAERAREFRAQFEDAVSMQLVSDVPVGLLLSGGLDSTAILCAMQRASGSVHAFTATYADSSRKRDVFEDDLAYARIAATQFGASLDEQVLETDVPSLLRRAVWHLDEPLADPTVITNLALTQAAKPSMTVLLSGMGADEILAGYPRYEAAMRAGQFPRLPHAVYGAGASMLRTLLRAGLVRIEGVRRFLQYADQAGKPFFDRYLGYSTTCFPELQGELLAQAGAREALQRGIDGAHRALFDAAAGRTPLTRMLLTDLRTFLPCLNLENTDKTSMANAVEMRVPFLDHRLVEFALALPDEDKLRGSLRKGVLRDAYRDAIPASILERKKTGYSPPVRGWLRGPLRELLHDRVLSARTQQRGMWNAAVVERLLRENDNGIEDHAMRLWALLVFEEWARVFIDEWDPRPAEDPAALPLLPS